MNLKINRHARNLTLICSLLHVLLSLYYVYLCLGNDFLAQESFWRIWMGGIRAEDSANLFYMILYLFPRWLFCLYVANSFMKDLKTNFIYIFLRTRNRGIWLRKTILKTAASVLYYEFFFICCALALKIFIQSPVRFSVSEFIEMSAMESLQLFMLALFSNLLFLFLSETLCIFGTLLELSVPTLVTGIIYENNGTWQHPAQWIPFNLGNYSYVTACHLQPALVFLGITLFCAMLYFIGIWRIDRYELI